MKKLSDGTEVSARTYYYLLDFNERYNWEFMYNTFNKKKLCELTIVEYRQLFEHATEVDKVTLIL
jgi:hypothetical protein